MTLRLSIVSAVKNCRDTVHDTLHSVGMQSYPQVEHVVVDGLSTDDTFSIAKREARVGSVLLSEPDSGVYAAFNRGVLAATGNVIGFLNGDDVYADHDVLARVAACLEATDCDGLYGDLLYVSRRDPGLVVREWSAGHYDGHALRRGWMPPHPTVFLRREVFQRIGLFDESYRISGDYEFLLRALLPDTVRLHYLPGILVRMRAGGMSNWPPGNLLRKWGEDLRAMRAHGLDARRTLLRKNVRKLPQLLQRAMRQRPRGLARTIQAG